MVRIRQESEANVSDDSIVNDGDGASRSIGLDHRRPSDKRAYPQSKVSRYDEKSNEGWPSHSIQQQEDPQNANPKKTPGSDIPVLPKIAAGRASVASNFSDELL